MGGKGVEYSMPLFEYECRGCGHRFEFLTRESQTPSCPSCQGAELQKLIRDTDKRIRDSFEETFEAAAKNFEEVVAHLFPGGRGKLRLVAPDQVPRAVLGGEAEAPAESEPDTADDGRLRADIDGVAADVDVAVVESL